MFSNTYYITVLVVLLFMGYTSLFWLSKHSSFFRGEDWIRYTSTLYSLGIICTVIALLFNMNAQTTQAEQNHAQLFATQTQNGFITIEDEFRRADPYLSALYKSMNPDNAIIQGIPNATVDLAKDARMEVHMANVIFQRIENVVIQNPDVNWDDPKGRYYEWLTTWRQWFQSERLQEIWKENSKTFYSQEFVNWMNDHLQEKY